MSVKASRGQEAVVRLGAEEPQWIPAVRAVLSIVESGSEIFAGARILAELRLRRAPRTWYPNFRRLVTYGIIERAAGSNLKGKRAFYRMPDPEGVRHGLAQFDRQCEDNGFSPARLTFTGIGRSGRTDLSARAEEILDSDFPRA